MWNNFRIPSALYKTRKNSSNHKVGSVLQKENSRIHSAKKPDNESDDQCIGVGDKN